MERRKSTSPQGLTGFLGDLVAGTNDLKDFANKADKSGLGKWNSNLLVDAISVLEGIASIFGQQNAMMDINEKANHQKISEIDKFIKDITTSIKREDYTSLITKLQNLISASDSLLASASNNNVVNTAKEWGKRLVNQKKYEQAVVDQSKADAKYSKDLNNAGIAIQQAFAARDAYRSNNRTDTGDKLYEQAVNMMKGE